MTTIKSISIPEGCSQSWKQMTPTNQGRHCEQCCKSVIDFTKMTNGQIIDYMSVKNNVCGRFGAGQIDSVNNQLDITDKTGFQWKILVTSLTFAGLFSFTKLNAKPTHTLGLHFVVNANKESKLTKDTLLRRTSKEKQQLKRARQLLQVKGTKTTSLVDDNGEFILGLPVKNIKCNSFEVPLTGTVGGVFVAKYSLPKRIWYKIKRIF